MRDHMEREATNAKIRTQRHSIAGSSINATPGGSASQAAQCIGYISLVKLRLIKRKESPTSRLGIPMDVHPSD